MNAKICIEGAGGSRHLDRELRSAFGKLLRGLGLRGRMPAVVVGTGRGDTFNIFKHEIRKAGQGSYIAMLVDSEGPS